MHDNTQEQRFTLTPQEQDLFPDMSEEWTYDEGTALLELVNERIVGIVDSAILSTMPHGAQREAMRQRIGQNLEMLTAMKEQLVPHVAKDALSDSDLQRLLEEES